MPLRSHEIYLYGSRCTLRPMTEDDWPILFHWNNDPAVLYFAEGEDVAGRTMADVQELYLYVAQNAFCFIIEHAGQPIGECWLQRMNLERILNEHPDQDCRRIDLMIGEKQFWGQGIGTEAIGLLCEFAFTQEQADLIFGCEIADYNPRSLRAFQRNGFSIVNVLPQPPDSKARICYDVRLIEAETGTTTPSLNSVVAPCGCVQQRTQSGATENFKMGKYIRVNENSLLSSRSEDT